MSLTPRSFPAVRRVIGAALAAAALAACASPPVDHYRTQTPALDLRQFFDGRLVGHGIVQDWRGEVTRRFRVDIDAEWDGEAGTLDEHFVWADGERTRRVWTLIDQGPDLGARQYIGRAGDVLDTARGEVGGNVMRWRYTLAVPVDGELVAVEVDDWLVRVDERVVISRGQLRKWGLPVGEVTLSLTRLEPPR